MTENGGFRIELDPDNYGSGYKDPFIQDEDKLSLADLIPRILIERKSFLNVTEDNLREEIENGEHIHNEDQSDAVSRIDSTESDINEQPQQQQENPTETFQSQKISLQKNINSAVNETSLSLDFVSLLLSAVKPSLAKSTISPHLQKNVPIGSLNSDRLIPNDEEDETNQNNKDTLSGVGSAWKLQSLNKITNLFRDASINLNEQVLKERRYWNMINLVLSNDEALFKTRDPINNARAIGVKYGYGDSGSSFHDRGLAILRKDNISGEVSFHPLSNISNKLTEKSFKFIRVKILSEIDGDFMLTGQSTFENEFNSSNTKLINDIEKARYFLFEEDLFYQLTREAKTLINYNVSIISNKIIIEINHEIIEIESVTYDENNEDILNNYYQNINTYSSINNKKCQLILIYLNLMLCCYFKYNLKLKQKIPTALSKFKRSNTHPLILRPLLGNIRHELNLCNMQEIIDNLLKRFKDEIEFKVNEVGKFVNLNKKPVENPFQKSIEKPVSEFKLILNNKKNNNYLKIDVQLTTNEIFVNLIINLNIIRYKNAQDFNNNLNGVNVLQISFNDFNEIEECLEWTILNFVN
ncbi:mediator of RNA polymerase II transcription subunit 17 [Scheffersomyces amazonensis]|uniref:mediator of RNA polymerase II transcription subunit 17 n=1 Tax=Scheffersomyces amazonensis TaxID=1078765 RepID=UPI00315D2AF8